LYCHPQLKIDEENRREGIGPWGRLLEDNPDLLDALDRPDPFSRFIEEELNYPPDFKSTNA